MTPASTFQLAERTGSAEGEIDQVDDFRVKSRSFDGGLEHWFQFITMRVHRWNALIGEVEAF